MASQSAGLLPFRLRDGLLEVFLVHPGGPFWARKDEGAWSLAKGEIGPGEDPLEAARREFREETGFEASGDFLPLGEVRQKAGKVVKAWAFRADFDAAQLRSNRFQLEWPPRAGRMQEFPEVDRAAWFGTEAARQKLLDAQLPFLDQLGALLGRRSSSAT